jgi:hypothetical protein
MLIAGILLTLIGFAGLRYYGFKIRLRLLFFIIITMLGLDLILFHFISIL